MRMHSLRFLLPSVGLGLVLPACTPKEDDSGLTATTNNTSADDDDDDDGDSGDDDDTGPTSNSGATEETGPSDETGPTDETAGPEDTGPNPFIQEPDGGGADIECDLWSQDCPEGSKCMPWDNMGGNSWNATKCSPLDDNPGQPGDPCTVEGSGVSGIDDCDISTMCWDVDPETNMGTCVGFCQGSEANPVCPDPGTGCSVTNDGTLILCLPFCDPLLQDCTEGNACYPEENGFFCSPDASAEMGAFGDVCEYLNVCDPGLFCANAELVPNCAGAIGCCSTYCDISEPAPTCMGAGQECTAYYEEGQAPPGYEDVGVCILPQ